MGSGITLWIRAADQDSAAAQAFLRKYQYAADSIRTLPEELPSVAEFEVLANAVGGDFWPLVNMRHPQFKEFFPHGAQDVDQFDLLAQLQAHPELLKVPILLTPRGAVAGFREQRWRAFLDIGKGR